MGGRSRRAIGTSEVTYMVGKGSINNFPEGERKVLSVSIDAKLIAMLKDEAYRRGKKVSHLAEEAIYRYLSAGPSPTHHIKELQSEITELAGQLHLERAKNRALSRELMALKRLNHSLLVTIDADAKITTEAKRALARIKRRELEIRRKEVLLHRKEEELAEKESEIKRKERELQALSQHLHEKEERLLRWEQMLHAELLSKRAPELVKQILEAEGLQAVGMKELREKYDWDLFFGKEEIQKAIEMWAIVEEGEQTVIRDVGQGFVYKHLKHNPLAGFFQLRSK